LTSSLNQNLQILTYVSLPKLSVFEVLALGTQSGLAGPSLALGSCWYLDLLWNGSFPSKWDTQAHGLPKGWEEEMPTAWRSSAPHPITPPENFQVFLS
jgi:hypothetical protein